MSDPNLDDMPDGPIDDEDNPEWTAEDFARAQGPETLPPEVLAAFPRTLARLRGQQKTPTKKPVSLRLSPEVVEHFRATGPGWQTRIDETLKQVIRQDGRS
ncbi:MAG: BrnA antitoxin family protein [Caulobacteraceae bacterium]